MKRVSLIMAALVAGFVASAQDAPQLRTTMEVKPRFGIKAGVNLARLEIDDDASAGAGANTNSKTSLHAGIFYQIPFSAAFRVQPELLYSIQGSKTNALASADPNLAGLNEYDLHYIALPVMFQFATPGGFTVELGPQVSYLSSANGDRAAGGEVDLKDGEYVKKIDFSAGGGIGYTSRVGLGLHARYMHGFTNIWNNEESPAANANMDYKNRNFQIGVHYLFGAAK